MWMELSSWVLPKCAHCTYKCREPFLGVKTTQRLLFDLFTCPWRRRSHPWSVRQHQRQLVLYRCPLEWLDPELEAKACLLGHLLVRDLHGTFCYGHKTFPCVKLYFIFSPYQKKQPHATFVLTVEFLDALNVILRESEVFGKSVNGGH